MRTRNLSFTDFFGSLLEEILFLSVWIFGFELVICVVVDLVYKVFVGLCVVPVFLIALLGFNSDDVS